MILNDAPCGRLINSNKGADMKFPKELEAKRTKCIVYTRVMGYLRPVESFNIGKVGEHKQRVLFEEKKNVKDVASTK